MERTWAVEPIRDECIDPLSLGPYRVKAFNTAQASENRIHSDAIALRFGFTRGLVPGVDVYAYMTHLPVLRWGEAFLAGGWLSCRFVAPVCDGDDAIVSAVATSAGIDLFVHSLGAVCATGAAGLLAAAPTLPVLAAAVSPAADRRPPASEATLAVGTPFASSAELMGSGMVTQYLRDVRETNRLFAQTGLLHPGLILRACNQLLMENVVLGPWIHTGSEVRNLGLARVGANLSARGVVAVNDVRKGHHFVELDVVVRADDAPVALVRHVAIWRPRQLGAD
jgi:acyl dehydratase